jgi:hypothetical protein
VLYIRWNGPADVQLGFGTEKGPPKAGDSARLDAGDLVGFARLHASFSRAKPVIRKSGEAEGVSLERLINEVDDEL